MKYHCLSPILCICIYAVGLEIVVHPSSLLVPVNEVGVFTCTASSCISCSGYWIVNGSFTELAAARDRFMMKGFRFLNDRWNEARDELTMTIMVNASEAVNNTRISCEFDPNGGGDTVSSSIARLFVINSKWSN